jgi:hypothetical protein
MSKPCAVHWFLAQMIFYHEEGDTFLRNVCLHTGYTSLYPRRWQHSKLPLRKPQILHTCMMQLLTHTLGPCSCDINHTHQGYCSAIQNVERQHGVDDMLNYVFSMKGLRCQRPM